MVDRNIELILLDLDGTLLNTESEVSATNKKVIKKLMQQGYKVAIATGRHYKEAKRVTSDLDDLVYITTNGSYVEDAAGKEIFSATIEMNSLMSVIDILEKESNLEYALFTTEEVLVKDQHQFLKRIVNSVQSPFKNLAAEEKEKIIVNNELEKPLQTETDLKDYVCDEKPAIHKILILGEVEELPRINDEIAANVGTGIEVTSSGPDNLEINAADISKGRALDVLTQYLEIPVEQTIAFGDSANDLELLETAQTAVVMENSELEELKEKADIIAPTNDDDGVAEILSDLLDIKIKY